jgi:hypothetical protein
MTPDQAASILEPLWIGAEASLERIAALRKEAMSPDAASTLKELQHLAMAEDFILAVLRRLDAAHVDAVAMDGMNGKYVIFPCSVPPKAQADAVARWLARTPKVREAREARRRAWEAKLEATVASLRKVTPLRTAAPPQEALEVLP